MSDKTFLTEKQKRELFKLINDGASKKDVDLKYFALTKKNLKLCTYKKYRRDAKKFRDGNSDRIRDYTLPAAQQVFEKKSCDVLEAYAKCGDLKHNTIREILIFVQKSFDDPSVTKLQFTPRYIARFIKTHRFRQKNPVTRFLKKERQK